jgi:mRNA interferase MazF
VVNARYDMLVIVPLTTTRLNGRLYPIIKKGDGALKNDSVALVDQLRSVDKQRVSKVGAPLSTSAMCDIDFAIKHLLGFDVD